MFNGGMMYRNIMVPVDGSTFSREAVLQGLRIASRSGATLRLVRVSSTPIFGIGPEAVAETTQGNREVRNAELGELYSIAAECRAHSTVSVTASLQDGPVVDALIGYAHRHRVDLIVMRSHARRGIARVWFGSVADKLIRESGIPVLVVRPPSVATALGSGFGFKRILVPLDGSERAEDALRRVLPLAHVDVSQITLLRVVSPARNRTRNELQSAIGAATAMDVTQARIYLDRLLTSDLDKPLKVTRRVVIADDVASTILRYAEIEESDLIAIATRGRGAIARARSGSVADVVMREAPVSAMVVHPDAAAIEMLPLEEGTLLAEQA
jgi:nucleotide-binding universal stress UspA family protein